jgi:hypothetical protein
MCGHPTDRVNGCASSVLHCLQSGVCIREIGSGISIINERLLFLSPCMFSCHKLIS